MGKTYNSDVNVPLFSTTIMQQQILIKQGVHQVLIVILRLAHLYTSKHLSCMANNVFMR